MTLEQKRATLAYQHVQQVTDRDHQKLYGGMAQKLPALIRSSGLCQALYFVKSRGKGGKEALNTLLDHLGEQLSRVDSTIRDRETLCDKARQADLADYVWLTREALATVSWYGRLARSEWGVLPGDDEGK